MPHQFLLDGDRSSHGIEPGAVAVAQRMGAQFPNSGGQSPPFPGCDPSDPSCNPPNPIATCTPGDFSCNPNDNGCATAYSARCQSGAAALQTVQAGDDPCLSVSGSNGSYNVNVNTTLSQGQCSQQGGTWAPPGSTWSVDSYGNLAIQPPTMVSGNACLTWGLANWWLRGLGLGLTATGVGSEVGVPLMIIGTASAMFQTAACAGGGSATF